MCVSVCLSLPSFSHSEAQAFRKQKPGTSGTQNSAETKDGDGDGEQKVRIKKEGKIMKENTHIHPYAILPHINAFFLESNQVFILKNKTNVICDCFNFS